ncbi:acyloxyacyl hydrolase [Olivibacter sitiensis]|uniref:acyloxyacyl hydrolase n=1 Tax=Olivibacter sitiensis TaxID=376470 RepID=UPI000A0704C5|nr:acyloxyacyl hydrolase [Olivibacter sitiensis]
MLLRYYLFFLYFFCLLHIHAQVHPRFLVGDSIERPVPRKSRLVFQLEHESGGELKFDDRAKVSMADSYYNAMNFRIGWQTQYSDSASHIYHELYNYPIYGVGFYSSTFGLEHVGHPYAVYGFVSVPISPKVNRRWNFNYRIALGLSSRFNPYDAEENPLNLIIGTRNNVFIDLGLQASYMLSKRFQIGLGTAFHHFSNGALVLPNTGINLLPLMASVTYIPSDKPFDFRKDEVPPMSRLHQLHVHYAFGLKQISLENEKQYFKSTLGVFWSAHAGYKWRLGAGLETFYSGSGRDAEVAGDRVNKFGSLFSSGAAFYIDHVLTQRLYMNGNAGYYLHRNRFNGERTPYYLRIGVRYKVYKDFYSGVSIKAHGGKADFIEWTNGYAFKW